LKKTIKNVFVITDTPIQSTMIVTPHAVKNLVRGAEAYNNDINAIDEDDVQYDAGQICTEDDQAMLELLWLNEYKLVLEIYELTWYGTYSKYPTLTVQVTDGVLTMLLRSSYRKPAFHKRLFSKRSPLYSGKMNLGMRIRLMDYSTSIWVDRKGCAHPCIFVEQMTAKPKRNCKKQMGTIRKVNSKSRHPPNFMKK
jgi:hypothetical protein